MFVVKKTGRVPVIAIGRGGRTGVFGVLPAEARAGLANKTLELVGIPNDIEVIEVSDGTKQEPEAKQVSSEPIEIPPDWETIHPLKRIKLANQITGTEVKLSDEQKEAGIKITVIADGIIRDEIQRRAAAETPAE